MAKVVDCRVEDERNGPLQSNSHMAEDKGRTEEELAIIDDNIILPMASSSE